MYSGDITDEIYGVVCRDKPVNRSRPDLYSKRVQNRQLSCLIRLLMSVDCGSHQTIHPARCRRGSNQPDQPLPPCKGFDVEFVSRTRGLIKVIVGARFSDPEVRMLALQDKLDRAARTTKPRETAALEW